MPPWWGGMRAPWLAGTAYFLILAVCTLLFLGRIGQPEVPQAVLDSKQALAGDLAVDLGDALAVRQDMPTRLADKIAESPDADPKMLLDSLLKADGRWSGLGLVDSTTRIIRAGAGEQIPGEGIRAIDPGRPTTRLLVTAAGPRLITAVPVADANETLIASTAIRVPDPAGLAASGTYVEVVDDNGDQIAANRVPAPAGGPAATVLNRATLRAADRSSGAVHSAADRNNPVVAAYAPVSVKGAAAGVRLAVVVEATVAPEHATAALVRVGQALAWWCGMALVLLAGVVAAALGAGVVRPVRRLADQVDRLAQGSRRVAVPDSRQREASRIASAINRAREDDSDSAPDPDAGAAVEDTTAAVGQRTEKPSRRTGLMRAGVPAAVVSVTCAVLLSLWSVLVPVLARSAKPDPIPAQVVGDHQVRVQTVASTIHRTIAEGRWDLAALAALATPAAQDGKPVAADATRLRFLLSDEIATGHRFRSVYTVDAKGHVQALAGAAPLRKANPVTAKGGIAQANTGGRAPIVYVATPLGGARMLVAEYDPHYLVSLVSRTGLGTLWLVDAERRITACNCGFRAFDKLPDDRLTRLSIGALDDGLSAATYDGGASAVRAASPLVEKPDQDDLRWALVSERQSARFALAGNELRRHADLVGLLGMSGVVLFFGWLHLVVIRPLRLVASDAERLADGDHSTVLFPQRHDEIGRLARGLEVLRRALLSGLRGPLMGVVLRGGSTLDETVLIPRPADLDDKAGP